MASIINASTAGVGGVITTADNTGNLNIQSGGTTKVAITSAGVGIVGTTTNNDASAGYVGEYIQSVVAADSVTAAANGVYKDLTSITLTAGDWDVTFLMDINNVGAAATLYGGGIGTATGNSATGLVIGSNFLYTGGTVSVGANTGIAIPSYRISIASTTTYYGKCIAYYPAGGPPKFGGRVSARRVR
jgi:hypothetical protein